MKYIDLHTHTNHTDGRHSVEYVLREAEKTGLSLFSISDHNSVAAYEEIGEHRHLFSGRILPAVELSTIYHGEQVEVLGYGIDETVVAPFIQEHYLSLHEKMVAESKLVARALHEKGVTLSPDFYETMLHNPTAIAELFDLGPRPLFLKDIQKHPENVRFFESEEELRTMTRHTFFRQHLFNPKSALYVDESPMFPPLREICDIIHRAGGLTFLAHTFVYSPSIFASLDDLTQNYDLDGLECHYGTFTKEQKKVLSEYCEQHGLYQSGGSDFHGYSMRPDNIMGLSGGERIEESLVAPWLPKVQSALR